eukprot:COSAG01_NODE_2213_length_8163_cov_18.627327_8_plen_82_part_00
MLGRVLVQADGAPAGNLSQVQQFIKTDRLYMDTTSNPAALNCVAHLFVPVYFHLHERHRILAARSILADGRGDGHRVVYTS